MRSNGWFIAAFGAVLAIATLLGRRIFFLKAFPIAVQYIIAGVIVLLGLILVLLSYTLCKPKTTDASDKEQTDTKL